MDYIKENYWKITYFHWKVSNRWCIVVGIFAFKCTRAEELFNMLQEIMQNNSINVVEEPVVERNPHPTEMEAPRTPRTPTSKFISSVWVLNGKHKLSCYLLVTTMKEVAKKAEISG